jgi:hypothetical protein
VFRQHRGSIARQSIVAIASRRAAPSRGRNLSQLPAGLAEVAHLLPKQPDEGERQAPPHRLRNLRSEAVERSLQDRPDLVDLAVKVFCRNVGQPKAANAAKFYADFLGHSLYRFFSLQFRFQRAACPHGSTAPRRPREP